MKTITRQELYDKIWSITKTKTAEELNLKLADLTKICLDNEIPTPSSNYWIQLSLGREVMKQELPNPSHNPDIALGMEGLGTIQVERPRKPRKTNRYSEILDQTLLKESKERKAKRLQKDALIGKFAVDFSKPRESWTANVSTVINAFPVQEILRTRRDIILQTKAYFRLQKLTGYDQMRHPDYDKLQTHLDILVGENLYDRSLCLFDAVINILEALGAKMIYEKSSTYAELGGVIISIRLSERTRREALPDAERRYGSTYKFVPSGEMRMNLCVQGRYSTKSIEDTSSGKIEEKLDAVVRKCLELVSDEYDRREYQRQQEIIREQEEERQRIAEEARRQLEKLRREEREEVRSVFSLLRREVVWTAIDGLLRHSAASEPSKDRDDLFKKLSQLQQLFNPLRTESVSGHLTEADIDALAEEFISGKQDKSWH